jgi:NADH dehydrogenase FAD-containing subunit
VAASPALRLSKHCDIAKPMSRSSIVATIINVSVLLAEVIAVDLGSRTVDLKYPGTGDKKVAFDYLAVAAGVQSSYFGHNEFAKYAPCLKTITDAQADERRRLRITLTTDVNTEEGRETSGPNPLDLYDSALGACIALTVL